MRRFIKLDRDRGYLCLNYTGTGFTVTHGRTRAESVRGNSIIDANSVMFNLEIFLNTVKDGDKKPFLEVSTDTNGLFNLKNVFGLQEGVEIPRRGRVIEEDEGVCLETPRLV